MQQLPLEVVERWHAAVNARDLDSLFALTTRDIELIYPRGSGRGHDKLRQWIGCAGFTAEPLRWFCGRAGTVVVEQRGRWTSREVAAERIVASAFRIDGSRITSYQRFDDLHEALDRAALTDDDEILP
jgi:hypothetical protein